MLAHVLGLEGKTRQAGERGGVSAEVVQVHPISRRLLVGMREGPDIGRAQRGRLAERKLVIETQQPGAGGGLGKLVPDEVERLERMRAGLEAADAGKRERLAHVGPVASARAALGRTVPDQQSMTELIRRAADLDIEGIFPEAFEKFP